MKNKNVFLLLQMEIYHLKLVEFVFLFLNKWWHIALLGQN